MNFSERKNAIPTNAIPVNAIPITEGLLSSLEQKDVSLVGSHCNDCGLYVLTKVAHCPRCASSAINATELSKKGTLWSWTSQSFMPPPPYLGPEKSYEDFKPFYVGIVELPNQLRVLCRLLVDDPQQLEIGMAMELQLFPFKINEQGETVISFGFGPELV